MRVAIIQYNAGNILSVDYALKRLGVEAVITGDHELIRSADRVIFPGVGEASTTMRYLHDHHLDQLICDLKQPVLGICLGLQLMCAHSEEGNTECLGIFHVNVKKFLPSVNQDYQFKVPHMGWNTLEDTNGDLFNNLPTDPYFYFVHSFYAETGVDTSAKTDYIVPFSAALQRDNFYATQFHPEKSGPSGAQLLENFINLKF